MRLLVIRHAIAMDREEYHNQALAAAREAGEPAKATSKAAVKATPKTFSETNDDFRPLTDEGIRKMHKNAEGLCEIVGRPDLLVTSPLTRAIQTAEILREEGWGDVEFATCDELRPEADPGDLGKWLRSQPRSADDDCMIAIVGHEPHLSILVTWFMTGNEKPVIELKKGGACLLEFVHGFEKSRGRLAWLATPAMLRAMR